MLFVITAIASLATLAAAAPPPIHYQATDYGLDPEYPFTLYGIPADTSKVKSYLLQPYYTDATNNTIGLQAINSSTVDTSKPVANYTLRASHYGTQLYAYFPLPCAAGTKCDRSNQAWGSNDPAEGAQITFQPGGLDGPGFGSFDFYGLYNGGDYVLGETNYLFYGTGLNLATAFSVCQYTLGKQKIQALSYHGKSHTCSTVTVKAFSVQKK